MSDGVCKFAWDSIRVIPYNEDGVKIFENIYNAMDDDEYIRLEVIGIDDGKLMVKFVYDESRFDVWEFYTGCEIVMCDTLCYPDEARDYLRCFVKFISFQDW